MTEIMPVPRKLQITVLPAGSFSPAVFLQLEGEEKERAEAIFMTLSRYDYRETNSADKALECIAALFSLNCFGLTPQQTRAAEKVISTKIIPLFEVALYCNKNYLYSIDRKTLVKISSMSRAGFFASFKKLFGITCLNYLHTLRMYRVRYLVGQSDYSLAYIADMMCFTDLAHMGKLFKQFYGITPLQYRKLSRSQQDTTPLENKYRLYNHYILDNLNIE